MGRNRGVSGSYLLGQGLQLGSPHLDLLCPAFGARLQLGFGDGQIGDAFQTRPGLVHLGVEDPLDPFIAQGVDGQLGFGQPAAVRQPADPS